MGGRTGRATGIIIAGPIRHQPVVRRLHTIHQDDAVLVFRVRGSSASTCRDGAPVIHRSNDPPLKTGEAQGLTGYPIRSGHPIAPASARVLGVIVPVDIQKLPSEQFMERPLDVDAIQDTGIRESTAGDLAICRWFHAGIVLALQLVGVGSWCRHCKRGDSTSLLPDCRSSSHQVLNSGAKRDAGCITPPWKGAGPCLRPL